jgi:hypothetical protein
MKKIMKNKSNGKNYNKEGELVSKENLELNAFHTQVTNKLKEDKIRVQNLYRDELILELEKNCRGSRITTSTLFTRLQ